MQHMDQGLGWMSWAMGFWWLLGTILVLLAIAALIKYLFNKR